MRRRRKYRCFLSAQTRQSMLTKGPALHRSMDRHYVLGHKKLGRGDRAGSDPAGEAPRPQPTDRAPRSRRLLWQRPPAGPSPAFSPPRWEMLRSRQLGSLGFATRMLAGLAWGWERMRPGKPSFAFCLGCTLTWSYLCYWEEDKPQWRTNSPPHTQTSFTAGWSCHSPSNLWQILCRHYLQLSIQIKIGYIGI